MAMTMHAQAHRSPTLPLTAMGVLVVVVLLAVAASRWLMAPADDDAAGPIVAERLLRFEDRADGGIDVIDARLGRRIDTVAPGSNGFLRSAMRGLVRERKRRGIGDALPFALSARADGRLILLDPGTGRRIDLEAFGPTNAGAFAQLLAPAKAHPERPA